MSVRSKLFGARQPPEGALALAGAPGDALPPTLLAREQRPRGVQGRRDRVLAGGPQIVADSLAEKILHGWLQNRHQTLFPLTVNLRTLRAGQAEMLAQWLAVAALATREMGGTAREWLASVGADAPVLARFDAALSDPPPLHAALADVTHAGLAAYAYVAALIATDPRDPAAAPFLDYVAARLALPTTVVRSAVRRYRR